MLRLLRLLPAVSSEAPGRRLRRSGFTTSPTEHAPGQPRREARRVAEARSVRVSRGTCLARFGVFIIRRGP